MKLQTFDVLKSSFSQIVGAENISLGESVHLFETATFSTSQKILGIVRPKNTYEVQACVKLCNEMHVPIYPVSGGRNWGYGSRVPVVSHSVVLDLGRLNQITDYNAELAYVTIEPGVTQQQLVDFLNAQGGRLLMDVTSSSSDSSIVGNYIERGHGVSPLSDHVNGACNFEVVLPSGEKIKTGYGRFSKNRLSELDKWGVGPALDGLFTQSNLGIITSMTIWLYPKPECIEMVHFKMKNEQQLRSVIDALRTLKISGNLRSGPAFVNDIRILTATTKFPWSDDRIYSAPNEYWAELREKMGVAAWSGSLGCYGPTKLVQAQKEAIIETIEKHVDEIGVITNESIPPQTLTSHDKYWQRAFLSMNGKMGPFPQRPFWRKKSGSSSPQPELDRDLCGFIWFPMSLPFQGVDAAQVAEQFCRIVHSYGFEPDICFTAVRDRTLQAYMSIAFDRENKEEDQRALDCQTQVIAQLSDLGYLPHRLGINSMDSLDSINDPQYATFIKNLKNLVDPNGILSPGRYV